MGYRNGGLAAAAGSPEEDPLDAAVETPAEIIEAAKQPETYGSRARAISRMTRDKALERLRGAETTLREKKYDKSATWLAFAQGMLAPTRTGGFGESVGAAAGLVGAEVGKEREFMEDRAVRLERMQSEMAGAEEAYADREIDILGEEVDIAANAGIKLRGQPFDTYIEDPEGSGKRVRVKAMMRNDGSWYVPRNPDGNVAILPDTLDPMTQYLREQARIQGQLDPKLLDERVKLVSAEKNRLAKSYYGLTILDALDAEGNQTGGIQKYIQQFREFMGSSADDVVDRGTLMNVMGQQLFESLKAFGTQINRKELEVAESLSGGIGRPSGINRQMLQDLVRKLETTVGETNRLVTKFGTDMQREILSTPMTDYGIGENLSARAQRIGLTMEEHIPFSSAPAGPDGAQVKTFEVGEIGHLDTPFEPADLPGAAKIIKDPANKGAHVRDPRTGKVKRI